MMAGKRVFLALAAAWALCWAAGCGDPKMAGATSETTNGDLQARVLNADGSAAARVRVLLVYEGDWLGKAAEGKSVILDSARTDAAGRFDMKLPAGRTCNLQIEGGDGGAFVRGAEALGGKAVRTFSLAAYARVTGKVLDGNVRELRLAGTAWTAGPDADRNFAFTAVAPGAYALMAFGSRDGAVHAWQARMLDLAAGAVLGGQDVAAEQAVLLDDFTAGWKQSSLGRLLGEGFWYLASDSADGGTSAVSARILSGPESYDGSSVRADYALGQNLINPWAIMGCNIGTSDKGAVYDFSGLTAISLMAKGSGTVNVKLLSKVVARGFKDSVQYFYPLRLPSSWTRIVIPVDSLRMPAFAPAEARAITWAQAAREIQTLDFTVEMPDTDHGDSVTFWADDIRLEGLSLDSLAR